VGVAPQQQQQQLKETGTAPPTSEVAVGLTTVEELAREVAQVQAQIARQLDARQLGAKVAELGAVLAAPDVWSKDAARANKVAREHAALKGTLDRAAELAHRRANALELAQLASAEGEAGMLGECHEELLRAREASVKLQLELLLDGPADKHDCSIEVTAGLGGKEACDWCEMLTNMYVAWAQRSGFSASVADSNPGESGLRQATVLVEGLNAYGWARVETGVHRMVRVSAHDTANRRHTCFAKVLVTPSLGDEDAEFDLPESDLRIDVMRAQGAGGQHVNKTESAVRITHIPTGINAISQQERSQHQNKKIALAVLKGRVLQLKLDKEEAQRKQVVSAIGEGSWGNQMRSYVLHPYKMVKDHRTEEETSMAEAFLAGDPDLIQRFMEAMHTKNANDMAAASGGKPAKQK
jgi:peptide chain release factor 2